MADLHGLQIEADECIARIITAHRAYMDVFATLEEKRFYRGMNISSFHALRLVSERSWPPSVIFVSQALRMHPSHASRLLTTLEREGHVTSRPDPHDGRQRLYSATAKGRSLMDFYNERVKVRAWDLVTYWPPYKQAEVMDLLERLVRRLRDRT